MQGAEYVTPKYATRALEHVELKAIKTLQPFYVSPNYLVEFSQGAGLRETAIRGLGPEHGLDGRTDT